MFSYLLSAVGVPNISNLSAPTATNNRNKKRNNKAKKAARKKNNKSSNKVIGEIIIEMVFISSLPNFSVANNNLP